MGVGDGGGCVLRFTVCTHLIKLQFAAHYAIGVTSYKFLVNKSQWQFLPVEGLHAEL